LSNAPVRNSCATRSISPEPHSPFGLVSPMTLYLTPPRRETLSMAPSPARMPWRTSPPSKAGPAEAEQASSHSLLPSTTSPFVPTSISRQTPSPRAIPLAMTSATTSPPT